MSITQIIALVRDAVVVGALGYILWFIHHADANAAKVADLKAVERQLDQNTATQALWAKRFSDAETQRTQDLQAVNASIAARQQPVIVRIPTSGGTVPDHPAAPSGGVAAGGPADPGPGIDIRSKVNAFETQYEGYLATCRALKAEWPR